MEYMKDLHELCEKLSEELADQNAKIKSSMTAGDLEAVDKLTHALKSIKTIIAMSEAEDEGYSSRRSYDDGIDGGSYRRGGSYRYDGMSYARGRGRNARRDSMGRYSSYGYSRAENGMDEIVEELRGMMDSLPEDKKSVVKRFVERVDSM